MDGSVIFWEFFVVALIFTAIIIASEFARRWLEKTERDNIQSLTETSNFLATETDFRSCDPHFLVAEKPVDDKIPTDSSSLGLCVSFGEKGPKYNPITSLEESYTINTESSISTDEDEDNIIEEIEE